MTDHRERKPGDPITHEWTVLDIISRHPHFYYTQKGFDPGPDL